MPLGRARHVRYPLLRLRQRRRRVGHALVRLCFGCRCGRHPLIGRLLRRIGRSQRALRCAHRAVRGGDMQPAEAFVRALVRDVLVAQRARAHRHAHLRQAEHGLRRAARERGRLGRGRLRALQDAQRHRPRAIGEHQHDAVDARVRRRSGEVQRKRAAAVVHQLVIPALHHRQPRRDVHRQPAGRRAHLQRILAAAHAVAGHGPAQPREVRLGVFALVPLQGVKQSVLLDHGFTSPPTSFSPSQSARCRPPARRTRPPARARARPRGSPAPV